MPQLMQPQVQPMSPQDLAYLQQKLMTPQDPYSDEEMIALGQGQATQEPQQSMSTLPPPVTAAAPMQSPPAKAPVAAPPPADAYQSALDAINAQELDSIKQQGQGLDDSRDQLKALQGKALPTDLTPLAALVDNWTGSNFTQSYRPPETSAQRQAAIAKLQDAISGGQNKLSESEVTMLRNKLNNQFQIQNLASTDAQRKETNSIERQKLEIEKMKAAGAAKEGKGLEQLDKDVAGDYNDFVLKGGYAGAQKALGQITTAVQALQNESGLTGTPGLKLTPGSLVSKINPRSAEIQNMVQDSVQENIKKIYGASVSKAEGDRILGQAWNKDLPQEVNIRNLQRIQKNLGAQLEVKRKAAEYFQNNGYSMRGYTGELPDKNAVTEGVSTTSGGGDNGMDAAKKWLADPANGNDPDYANVHKKVFGS